MKSSLRSRGSVVCRGSVDCDWLNELLVFWGEWMSCSYFAGQLLWDLRGVIILGLLLQRLAEVFSGLTFIRWPCETLWLMVERAIIGSEMQDVIGCAIAFNRLLAGWYCTQCSIVFRLYSISSITMKNIYHLVFFGESKAQDKTRSDLFYYIKHKSQQ